MSKAKKPVICELAFPQILKDWLKQLPPDEKVREYTIARINLNRIAQHMHANEAEQIHFS